MWLMPNDLRTLLIARRTFDGVSAALPALTRGVCELHGIRGAVEVEPGAGGRVVLVILDAEERNRLRARQAVVNDDVGGDGARRNVVYGDRFAWSPDRR